MPVFQPCNIFLKNDILHWWKAWILTAQKKEDTESPLVISVMENAVIKYIPPYSLTSTMMRLVSEISELVGKAQMQTASPMPHLRKNNRIRTVHASLAIENNSLSVEQVTAILDGKHVLGLPKEIQEVRNAFKAYEKMEEWNPSDLSHLLDAHGVLMSGLVDHAGQLRTGGVGVFEGSRVIHMAPPAHLIHSQMQDLLHWLAETDEHPLISSCVFHYEFEFIHPFEDGNGRMGRLWQTLILSRWKPLFAYLPVETVIHSRQKAYYAALGNADQSGESTAFIEFLLEALLTALREATEG